MARPDRQTFRGVWWPAGDDSKKVGGELTLRANFGAELALDGTPVEIPWTPQGPVLDVSTIYGTTHDSKTITLTGCSLLGLRGGFGFPQFVTVYCERVFVGAYMDSDDEPLDSMVMSFETLDDWTADWLIKPIYAGHGPKRKLMGVRYEEPGELRATVPQGTITLGTSHQIEASSRMGQVEAGRAVHVKSALPLPVTELYREFGIRLQHLLVCATMQRSLPTNLTLVAPDERDPNRPLNIEVLGWPGSSAPREHTTTQVRQDRILFTLRDVRDRFSDFLLAWFSLHAEIGALLSRFFGTEQNPGTYLEHQAVDAIQCLEGFHRARRTNEIEPQEVFEARKKRIRRALAKDDREWLTRRLQWANEPSLYLRLEQLLDEVDVPLRSLIPVRSRKTFINEVVGMRAKVGHPVARATGHRH